MHVGAVRARYEHINHSWQRSTAERRGTLIGELELLSLQLPVISPDDGDQTWDDIVALRADILALIDLITGDLTGSR